MAAKKKATARKTKVAKKSPAKKPGTSKPKTGKKPFGGYAISFAGRKETVEQVFGSKPIAPSEMTKRIWAFVKSEGLSNS